MDDKSFEALKKKLEGFEFEETFDMIVAIANGGIIPAALLNQKLNIEIQLLKLHFRNPSQQPEHAQPKLMEPILFDVKDKNILLVEDRIKTGASLEMARDLLFKNGAKSIKTFAVNGNADYFLFNESCFRFPWILAV